MSGFIFARRSGFVGGVFLDVIGSALVGVVLAGALRHEGDGAIPGPVAFRRVEPGKIREVDVIHDGACRLTVWRPSP